MSIDAYRNVHCSRKAGPGAHGACILNVQYTCANGACAQRRCKNATSYKLRAHTSAQKGHLIPVQDAVYFQETFEAQQQHSMHMKL
eukprot:744770-Pelagomonas_calceolata.AAC.2